MREAIAGQLQPGRAEGEGGVIGKLIGKLIGTYIVICDVKFLHHLDCASSALNTEIKREKGM